MLLRGSSDVAKILAKTSAKLIPEPRIVARCLRDLTRELARSGGGPPQETLPLSLCEERPLCEKTENGVEQSLGIRAQYEL